MVNRRSWIHLLLIASLVSICFATISPFNFLIPKQLTWQEIIEKFHYATNIKDYIRNILLFLPFGIACGGAIACKKYPAWQIITSSFLLGAILSSSIELIQILLPSRISSFSDIVCNSLGGFIGASLYCWRREFVVLIEAIFTKNYRLVNLKFLAVIIICYCTFVSLGIAIFINSVNFNNWDDNYYLSIGSEVTGQAPWNGYITSIYICDRALEDLEILSAFKHTHSFFSKLPNLVTSLVFLEYRQSYSDRSQHLSDFIWQTKFKPNLANLLSNKTIERSTIDHRIHNSKTVLFNRQHSLISISPVIRLNQKIKTSQEFSLSIILASNKRKQVGSSRIVSLANNIDSHNMMIAQENSNLVFRLRTPTTGLNATQPSLIIPKIFEDGNLHQILITFTQRKLTFFIDRDDNQYTFEFQPSTHLKLYSPLMLDKWRVNLQEHKLLRSQIIFYSLILFPLAILICIFILGLVDKSIEE